MNTTISDIENHEDVKKLVDHFYGKVKEDELLGPIFEGAPGFTWEHHLPTMYRFWETLLFRAGTYQGQPWPKHAVLQVDQRHFDRWLGHFIQTLHENFFGATARMAEGYARSIADTFQRRMTMLQGM